MDAHETMKLCLLFGILLAFAGCANRASLPPPQGVAPLEPAHTATIQPGKWMTSDGAALPYSVWQAKGGRKKAVVILAPGWDATMRDYTSLAEYLSAHGYAVYGSEQRGGVYDPVPARRGDERDWRAWPRDMTEFTRFVAKRNPGSPIFYHGHSFGALVVLEAAHQARNDRSAVAPRGLVLQSVAMPFVMRLENSPFRTMLSVFDNARYPQLTMIEIMHSRPTGDNVLNSLWVHSPDRLTSGYTVRFFRAACALGHAARVAARDDGPPTLALKGQKDGVVAYLATQKMAYDSFLTRTLRGGKADVIRYENGYHTMTIPHSGNSVIDAVSAKAKADIVAWLDAHL
jgi:alpha-beta hydrolase superfamily lysophospholipase